MSNLTNCIHKFKTQKTLKELSFCTNCGIIVSIKPIDLERKIELDPFEVQKKFKEQKKNLIDYKNPIHKKYLKLRKFLLNTLKELSLLQSLEQETFYLCIYYLDCCILKPNLTKFLQIEKKTSNFLQKFTNDGKLQFERFFTAVLFGCFSLANKFTEVMSGYLKFVIFDYAKNNFNFEKSDIYEFESFCFKVLDSNMNDISSFSIIKNILSNGILDKNEIDDLKDLENLHSEIYRLHLDFVNDNRFLDFNEFDIAISIITYTCQSLNFSSWRNFIARFYYNGNIKLMPCFFIIERIFSINSSQNFCINQFNNSPANINNNNNNSNNNNNNNNNNNSNKYLNSQIFFNYFNAENNFKQKIDTPMNLNCNKAIHKIKKISISYNNDISNNYIFGNQQFNFNNNTNIINTNNYYVNNNNYLSLNNNFNNFNNFYETINTDSNFPKNNFNFNNNNNDNSFLLNIGN